MSDIAFPTGTTDTNLSGTDRVLIDDGVSAKDVAASEFLDRGNHTGTQTASTISDIDTYTGTLTNKTIDADNNTISNIGTDELSDNAVTFAKIQDITTNTLLGRTTSGSGNAEEIGIGNNLEISGSNLQAKTGTTSGTVAEGNHLHTGVYEPVITKNTAFNKDFGTTSGTVLEGDKDAEYAKLTGNQTIAGVKTFSSSPVVPTPTTDFQAATKKYVDDNAGGGGASDLDGLTDVTITTPTNGEALIYNGTNWANTALSGGGDMLKATYDTDNNGIVDNSEALGGQNSAYHLNTDNHTSGTTNKVFTATEQTKLAGIETGATADQTGAEIKTLYEAEADTNAFTDAEKTKLSGIEANATADQTDAEIETAYNNQVSVVSQADAEAGTSTTVYRWTPERVAQAIAALGGGGSGDKEFRITIPGEQIADTSNYQGLFLYNNTGSTITISNVAVAVGTAASGTGAALAVNIYKSSGTASDGLNTNAVALFSSAISLGTSYTSLTNTPTTTTVESGRWVTLRVTSSAGATNKASNLQCIITYS